MTFRDGVVLRNGVPISADAFDAIDESQITKAHADYRRRNHRGQDSTGLQSGGRCMFGTPRKGKFPHQNIGGVRIK